MNKPKIPTLHSGPIHIASNKKDIVAYIVRHALNNPGGTSSYLEHELISFRKMEAEFGEDGEALAQEFENKLSYVLYKYFGDNSIVVQVNHTQYAESSKYKLTINVSDVNGEPLLNNTTITIDNRKIYITYTPE